MKRRFAVGASRNRLSRTTARAYPLADRLEEHVERRYCEDPDKRGEDHAAKYRCPDVAARQLGRSARDHKRIESENERERCHHDRTESVARALDRGLPQR